MTPTRRTTVHVLTLAIAITAVLSLSITAFAGDDALTEGPALEQFGCADYADSLLAAAPRQHSDVLYDIERDEAVITLGNVQWVLDGDDPACIANPDAAGVLRSERATMEAMLAQACPDMLAAITNGGAEVRGHAINLDGARAYVEDFC